MNSGIYQIRNLIDGKVYIGSSRNIFIRWQYHKKVLKKNKHYNQHLQFAWNKYGEQNFSFEIIEYIKENFLIEAEQFWIDDKKSYDRDFGYNFVRFINYRSKHSIETKRKLSEINKGKTLSKEQRKKLSDYRKKAYNDGLLIHPWIGRKHTKETKEKMKINHCDISGENNGRSKLTKKDIIEIREKYIPREYSARKLGKEYGVTKTTILAIINYKLWSKM